MRRTALLVLGVLMAALAAGCGGGSSAGTNAAVQNSPQTSQPPATSAAPDQDKDEGESANTNGACPKAVSGHRLPTDIPTPKHAVTYKYAKQGATRIWFLSVPGDAGELVKLRDAYDKSLTSAGYEIEDTDQEPGHEAESEFHGAHSGTTNFRGLCSGRDVFRLTLER